MPKYAELADGRVLEFPDEASDQVMNDAVSRFIQSVDTEDRIAIDVPEETGEIFFEDIGPSVMQQNEASINNAITFDSTEENGLPLIEQREEERNSTVELARSRFPKHTVDMWLNNPIGIGEVGDFIDWSQILPAGGIVQGAEAVGLLRISDRIREGQDVSEADKQYLDKWLDKSIEMEVRGMTFGGKFRYYGEQIPAFVAEFAATGGVGKSVQVAALKTTQELVKSRVLGQVAGATARVATQSAMLMPVQGYKAYGNIRISQGLEISETGQLIFREAKESPAISALKAYGYVSAEIAAELTGLAVASKLSKSVRFQKGKVALASGAITSINKLPANLKNNLYKAYQLIKPNARMSEVFTRAGWNGMLMELGEERVADILRESVDLALTEGYTMADVLEGITPDAEQLLLESGLIMTMGGAKAGATAAVNLLVRKGMALEDAKKSVDQLTSLEQDALVDDQLTVDDTPLVDEGVVDNALEKIDQAKPKFTSQEQKAINFIKNKKDITTGQLQRHLKIGYNQTVKIIESLQSKNILSDMKMDTVNNRAGYQVSDNLNNIINPPKSDYANVDQAIEESIENIDNPAPDLITSAQQDQLSAGKEPDTIAADESIFDEVYYKWIDDLGALVDVAKEAAKRGKETFLENSVRLYAGVTGMALSSLNNGTTVLNEKGELIETGKGLKSILNDFDFNAMRIERDPKKRKKDLIDYLIARRYALDLKDRDDVKITEKQKEKSIKDLARISEKYGEDIVLLDTSAQEIYDYQDRMLQMLVSFGVMSQDKYNTIKAENPNYIPFQRVMDEEYGETAGLQGLQVKAGTTFAGKKLGQVIKKIEGSDKKIVDPIESIIRNTMRITDIAYQNRVANQLVDLADVMPEYISTTKPAMKTVTDPKTGTKISRPRETQPADVITVLVKGKRKYYKVHPSLVAAMTSMHPQEITGLGWLLSRPASILRTGATIVPEFMARNFIRDVHGSYVLSEARPNVIDVVKGLTARIGKNDLYERWRASGASFNSYMNMSDEGVKNAYAEIFKEEGKLKRYLKNPLNLPQDIGAVIEQSVRIGVYNAAKRKGMTDAESAMEARDASIDFARGGSASKEINKYVPFFNAGVQGSNKFIRAFRKNPKAMIMYASATITIPQILITGYYLHVAPEEEKKEYLEIPEWQRDMFWVFKVGDTWARYPKPFTVGFAFGSTIERAMIWADSEGETGFADMFFDLSRGLVTAVSPVYDPSAVFPSPIKTAVEQVTNYNFFQGRRIYPEWMDDLPPEERKTAGTSLTAQELGKVFNYSPAKIDNLIRGTFATSGPYLTDAGDILLEKVKEWNGEEFPEDPTSPVDIPLVRAFTMRYPTGGMSNSVQQFYETKKLATQVENGLDIFEDERLEEYRQENEALISATPIIKAQGKRISQINRLRKNIYEDLGMSGKEKEQVLRDYDDQILDAARIANEALSDALRNLEK